MNNIDFARNLVKGKIAETIFAQMHREAGGFTVLEFGYEKIISELIQRGYNEGNNISETLRTAPDFVIINQKTKAVKLVEVKYLRVLKSNFVLDHANRMSRSWNPSYLFFATPKAFYFDGIETIIKNNGDISKLGELQISAKLQDKYRQILIDFEGKN